MRSMASLATIAHTLVIPHEGNEFRPHLLRHKPLALYSSTAVLTKLLLTLALFILYPTTAFFSTVTGDRVLELINAERESQGLLPLARNTALVDAAQSKVQDMLQKNYFAHWAPDGISPWTFVKRAGYLYTYAGENLGMGFTDAESLVSAWMASARHRKNILSPYYREIGIWVEEGQLQGKQTTLVVEFFGTSYLATPQVAGASAGAGGEHVVATSPSSETAGESVTVELVPPQTQPLFVRAVRFLQGAYGVVLVGLIVLLLANIVVRIRVQHAPIIFHTLFVIVLMGALFTLKTHFLEGPIGEQLISLL